MSGLDKYHSLPVVLTKHQTWHILSIFWNPPGLNVDQLTDEDVLFAQALVLEAADASAKVGFIETLWKSAANPTTTAKDIFKEAAKQLFKYVTRDKSVKGAVEADKYLFVVNVLANNFSTPWTMRKETGETSWLFG